MSMFRWPTLTRRSFLSSVTAIAVGTVIPGYRRSAAKAASTHEVSLRAAAGRIRLMSEPYGETAAWCYNATVPGPEIRIRQGDRIRVTIEDGLPEDTTVHWHGVRTPNAMDGVPYLTQPPIEPGETFVYEFDAVDAGTFWYHPHLHSFAQVDRGLYGPLIIDEIEPIQVDRDITWLLDDWRLTDSAEITDDFGNPHDMSHSGRIGNVVTINGQIPGAVEVRSGERIRLRLINAANARIFALDFADIVPQVIALDGQPVVPHAPENGLVVLGPAMRADLILDPSGGARETVAVTDRFYDDLEYTLINFVYADTPLRDRAPDWPIDLPANPLAEPDLSRAKRHEIVFNGGMMGGMVMEEMGSGMMSSLDSMMNMASEGRFWFVNGAAAMEHDLNPLLTLEKGQAHVIVMTNETAWNHPMHLHGHSFRVISRNGQTTRHREWRDTVLIGPRERVEIAFVADNPGDWMFHCHILEHQASGMMSVVRVA